MNNALPSQLAWKEVWKFGIATLRVTWQLTYIQITNVHTIRIHAHVKVEIPKTNRCLPNHCC